MQNVYPLNYALWITPNLETFTFEAKLQLTCESDQAVDAVVLNALELTITSCRLVSLDHQPECDFALNADKESLEITLAQQMTGRFRLEILYQGLINDKMAGFYRSNYSIDGIVRPIAVTQFQESDARRAFPCFDHPRAKATFDITLIIDQELTAVSNQEIAHTEMIADNRQKVFFKRTPKMSTYLVFWAVGPFALEHDPEEPRARVAYLPGMEPYTHFGLDFGKKALRFCEDYYGIAYPLAKVDLIAIQDFAFGAMENWGAITFRENLLLYYAGITSKAGQERIAEVIAHEMAHQWFGNLVTPEDWKYLWLNESFATYFGFGVVAHYFPEWDTWSQFLYSQTGSALSRDAHWETIPIEIPGGEHVVINSSTAPIIYCKGGSILRQIKGYIGEADFKQGLRHYLNQHAYQCAASDDLWQAFETVSNKPVTHMIQSWVEQPGYPLVEVKREGDNLHLTQRRFTYMADDLTLPSHPSATEQIWQVPVSIHIQRKSGKWERRDILLDAPSSTIDLGADARVYKVNADQTGFYRVKYHDGDNLERVGQAILDQSLSAEDRWGVQEDLYALVKAGDQPITAYLNFVENYQTETAFLPLISIVDNLLHAYLVLNGPHQPQIAAIGRDLIEKVLRTIGLLPQANEAHTTSILRDRLLWQAVFWGAKEITAFTQQEFKRLKEKHAVDPDITKSVMQAGAYLGDRHTYEWFINRLENTTSEHDRTNILNALGCFSDTACIQDVQDYVLTKVPPRNQSIPITALAVNPSAIPGLWDWYTSEQEAFASFHPLIHERVILGIIPLSGMDRQEAINTFFNRNAPGINPDVVKLLLEKLEINCRMRARHP